VPWYGGHCHLPSSPSWGAAYPSLVNWIYEYYDDFTLMKRHYDGVKAYTDSLTARAKVADIQNHTLLDTGGWGDWCAPTHNINKTGCGGTGVCGGSHHYITALRIMKNWAEAVQNLQDLRYYGQLDDKVTAAFMASYYSSEDQGKGKSKGFNCHSTRKQTANAIGLQVDSNLGPALDALVEDVLAQDVHLDTGIVGTKWLLESLAQKGRADLALGILLQPTYPGFGYWISQGATSLWETWEGARYQPRSSWNHAMFGSTSEFFFRHLAGIQQSPGTRGYSSIHFRPSVLHTPSLLNICKNLSWVNASLTRPHGVISASWACIDGSMGIQYNVSTPVGVLANVSIPAMAHGSKTLVKEGESTLWDGEQYIPGVKGVRSAALETDRTSVIVSIGSGRFSFSASAIADAEFI